MLVNVNKAVFFFFILCFMAMAIPYVLDLGDGNVFKRDFYAKRIMTLFLFPFFSWVIYSVLAKKKPKIHQNVVLYLAVYALVMIISVFKGNRISLIITDAFIAFLPVFFYLLVYKTNTLIVSYKSNFIWYLLLASLLVVFNVKLQFSYFSLIAIVYILFYAKFTQKNIILFLALPILTVNSLIGKSALLMLLFLISYFFIFDSKNVSKKKKIYLLLVPAVIITILTIYFWDKIQATGAYRNFIYFLRHANFKEMKFTDMSTSHRLFEAQVILEKFSNNNLILKIFGNGFGSTLDLSGTVDQTIANANSDIHNVRNIHMGFFAVLSRYGLIGIFIYLFFIYKMTLISVKILKKQNHFSITLGALYILIILFDSLISFPHMMSNFMFWYITFVILYEYKVSQTTNYNEFS